MKNGDFPVRHLNVYQRVPTVDVFLYHTFIGWIWGNVEKPEFPWFLPFLIWGCKHHSNCAGKNQSLTILFNNRKNIWLDSTEWSARQGQHGKIISVYVFVWSDLFYVSWPSNWTVGQCKKRTCKHRRSNLGVLPNPVMVSAPKTSTTD